MIRTIAVAAMTLLTFASCTSPLDLDTKRIDTRLTNYIKFRSMTVEVERIYSGVIDTVGTVTPSWKYVADKESFMVDTSTTPPSVWLDFALRADRVSSAYVTLEELRIRLDDERPNPLTTHFGDPNKGSGIYARINFNGQPYETSYGSPQNFTSNVRLEYSATPRKTINGVISLVLTPTSGNHVRVIARFVASQD